jgi:hypothetical protein
MKYLILFFLALALTGCKSMEQRIQKLTDIAATVDTVEFKHNGFWSAGEMVVDANQDGTRDMTVDVKAKIPGGPSFSLAVEGIQPAKP